MNGKKFFPPFKTSQVRKMWTKVDKEVSPYEMFVIDLEIPDQKSLIHLAMIKNQYATDEIEHDVKTKPNSYIHLWKYSYKERQKAKNKLD